MKLRTLVASGLMLTVLSACKTSVISEVSVSDLLSGESKQIPGELHVEVASCNDYKDSRKPSDSLLDIQKKVPEIFPAAEYKECFRQRMDSFASFSLPLQLDADNNGKLESEDRVTISSNERFLLGVVIPKKVQRSIQGARKSLGTSLKLSVSLNVKNDTNAPFEYFVGAAYIDDKPTIHDKRTARAGATFSLKLSDVAVDAALSQQEVAVLWPARP